jgi:dsRNA-specific ribonuclease
MNVIPIPTETPTAIEYQYIPGITSEFVIFIRRLLRLGGLKDNSINDFTDPTSMKIFRLAFIDKSYDSRSGKNYEMYEFLGDKTMNCHIARYLHWRFPYILTVSYITQIHHRITSKKVFGQIAENFGFFEHIMYGNDLKTKFEKMQLSGQPLKLSSEYRDMMEDTVESFAGAAVNVITRKRPYGVADAVLYNIVYAMMNTIDIPLEYNDVRPYKMRLNELYMKITNMVTDPSMSREERSNAIWTLGRGKGFVTEEIIGENEIASYRVTIYGWFEGNKPTRARYNRRTIIVQTSGDDRAETEERASKKALEILNTQYGIAEYVKNPFK